MGGAHGGCSVAATHGDGGAAGLTLALLLAAVAIRRRRA
jgi:MYXO-CTERM domain-containing protein